MEFSYLLGAIIGSLFSAFFGCRFLKLTITITSAFAGYYLGSQVIGLAIADMFEGADIALALGIFFALLFGLLAARLYRGLIYLIGSLAGGAIGFVLPYYFLPTFGVSENVSILVGIGLAIVLAVIFAKLLLVLLKVVIIIETSFGGALLASFYAFSAVIGYPEGMLGLICLGVSVVLGFVAMVTQFKMNKGRDVL